MNGMSEMPRDVWEVQNEAQDLSVFKRLECDFETIKEDLSNYWEGPYDDVSDYAQEIKDIIKDLYGQDEISDTLQSHQAMFLPVINDLHGQGEISEVDSEPSDTAREYGLRECSESAKKIITYEVISEWGTMSLEERNLVAQEYATAIGKGLGINFRGIVWENFDTSDGKYTFGYNNGDGYVYLNADFLCNPGMLIQLVDTIAHEARHQFQMEAIANPEKFNIDKFTIHEWSVGKEAYTTELPSAYDPWGYTYNPLEIDSKIFGQTMVREITKSIINA